MASRRSATSPDPGALRLAVMSTVLTTPVGRPDDVTPRHATSAPATTTAAALAAAKGPSQRRS